MNKIRRLLAIIMLIPAMVSFNALAAEESGTEDKVCLQSDDHSHVWVDSYTEYTYTSKGTEQHMVSVYVVIKCSICGIEREKADYSYLEDHIWYGDVYTGVNYHSGNYHFFQYSHECEYCHEKVTWNNKIPCPGGNTHVTINNIRIPEEIIIE